MGTLSRDGDPYGRISDLHRLRDGTFVAGSRWNARVPGVRELPEFTVSRDSLVLRHLDTQLRTLDTVAVLPAAESLRQVTARPSDKGTVVRRREMPRPLGRNAAFTLADGFVIAGTNDSFEWEEIGVDGRRRLLSRAPGLERRVTTDVLDGLRGWYRSLATTREQERQASALLEDYPLPGAVPAFSTLRVDPAGRVWVARYRVTPDEPSTWYIFSASGRLLGRAALLHGMTVDDIGTDHVLGVWRNDLDVPFVVRVPLVASHQ